MKRFVNISVLIVLLYQYSSCSKEYSYERKPVDPVNSDTTMLSTTIPGCSLCNSVNSTELKRWSFVHKNSLQCGVIDTAIITPNKNAFTFFGPSSCSSDTGLVITAYLDPIKLDKDVFNFTTNHVAYYYYDHIGPTYIFMVRPPLNFSLTIESYIHQTGIIKGRFSGSVFQHDNSLAIVESGKFMLKLY